MKQIRLDKYLTQVRNLSRSEAKQYIKKGRVLLDGAPAKKPEQKLDPEQSIVLVDGEPCRYQEYVYLMLHKPQGVVSATEDAADRTVLDCVDAGGRRLFPVGRLDKDTEGLLLLTDDGVLAHDLLSPAKHVDKCYYALLDGSVGEEEKRQFAEGLDIGDEKKTMPAVLECLGPVSDEKVDRKDTFAVRITIREGRFHQIKRMAKAVGREVLYLKRLSMGSLRLDESLQPGESRPLTEEELASLKGRK